MTPCLSFAATGSQWWLTCDMPNLLVRAESMVRAAERRLSRFLPDSSLSRLNRAREIEDPTLADVVRAALRMRDLTAGAFDATLGVRLRELGYAKTFPEIGVPHPAGGYQLGSLLVTTDQAYVRLEGMGELDLGGIAKGWIVDRVVDMLIEAGARSAVVDGGGDIRVLGGPWPIEFGSGRVVEIESEAIATSSIGRRRWRDSNARELHHILDPRTGDPVQPALDTVTIRAKEAAVADALATAALADAQRVFEVLPSLGAHAAARDGDGNWWTTRSWAEAA